MKTGFSVTQENGVTKIENETEFILVIFVKPIKPKRKWCSTMIIPPNSFCILDHEIQVDLTKIAFTLESL